MPVYLHSHDKEGLLICIISGQMNHHNTINVMCDFMCTSDLGDPKLCFLPIIYRWYN